MNEGSLHKTYIELKGILEKELNNYRYEIIFVNDGSADNSLKELISIKEIDSNVKIINFSRNFGQLYAILAGFDYADGDFIINISADLQDPVEIIPQMIKKWEEGVKIVACERSDREDSFISRLTSKLFYGLIKINEPKMPVGGYDYFLLDKCVYKKIAESTQHNSFLQGDILWFGYEPFFISYTRKRRLIGRSRWFFWKKVKYFIDGVIYTSYMPIRLMSFLGFAVSTLGFIYAILIFIAWLMNKTPFSGYAPIIMTILLVSGILMIMIGIVGEYLWRIYDEVRARPKYIIKDIY
jgi:dolichol-phosphate mannosyltransferase